MNLRELLKKYGKDIGLHIKVFIVSFYCCNPISLTQLVTGMYVVFVGCAIIQSAVTVSLKADEAMFTCTR